MKPASTATRAAFTAALLAISFNAAPAAAQTRQLSEAGLRDLLKGVSVQASKEKPGWLALGTMRDPDIQLKSTELSERLGLALGVPPGTQSIEEIQSELVGAQTSMQAANERHTETKATMEDLLQTVEGISNEEVAAMILTMPISPSSCSPLPSSGTGRSASAGPM